MTIIQNIQKAVKMQQEETRQTNIKIGRHLNTHLTKKKKKKIQVTNNHMK
jgi:hypothetical protein